MTNEIITLNDDQLIDISGGSMGAATLAMLAVTAILGGPEAVGIAAVGALVYYATSAALSGPPAGLNCWEIGGINMSY
jgi:hypothetical protein